MSSRPSPSALAPGSPSTPAGSLIRRPSIWKPPQMPSTARPWAACSWTAVSSPRSRSQPRSARVARVPGSTTTSAECSARGWSTNATSTWGSRPRASMSVKLLIRGSLTTATRSRSPSVGAAAARSPTDRESSESSHRRGSQGSTPSTGRWVTDSSVSRPGRSRPTSPRNLLTTSPLISAWSASSSNASVPCMAAKTPPRSMSPTRRAGIEACLASPMLMKSWRRRFTSAGLPAPSHTTTSKRLERSSNASYAAADSASRPPAKSRASR